MLITRMFRAKLTIFQPQLISFVKLPIIQMIVLFLRSNRF